MKTALWEELVNSDRHDYLGRGDRVDSLDDPRWTAAFLKRWGLEARGTSEAAMTAALKELRSTLQSQADALAAGRPAPPRSVERLNSTLAGASLVRRLVPDPHRPRLKLVPARRTAAWILSEIAASWAETLSEGELSRIKSCGNRDCRWLYYDASKNKGRKWCGLGCGNLMKVRRFRKKGRAPAHEHGAPKESV